jgi:hypothetical protein
LRWFDACCIFFFMQQNNAAKENQNQRNIAILQKTFELIAKEQDPFRRELYFVREAAHFELPLEQIRSLYNFYADQQAPQKRLYRLIPASIRQKVAWDWLQLLIVPLVLALGTWSLGEQAKVREESLKNDKEKQEILIKYFDFMTDVLSKEEVKTKEDFKTVKQIGQTAQLPASKLWIVARARTLTALRELNDSRKIQLLSFLKEAGLIERQNPRIRLATAELKKLDLSNMNLTNSNLAGVE